MFWLVVGVILGFAGYCGWWLVRPGKRKAQARALLSIVGALLVVAAGAGMLVGADTLKKLPLYADDGATIRFFIGLILGVWGGAIFESGATRFRLSYAVGLALLAIVAPHLDQWLSHVASFKTSFVEIQLTNISTTAKAIRSDKREAAIDDLPLDLLASYASSIEYDIKFITVFELPYWWERLAEDRTSIEVANKIDALNRQRIHLRAIHDNFVETLVSPLASCVKNAIGNGWSIDSVRGLIRPLGDAITRLILFRREGGNLKNKSDPDLQELEMDLKWSLVQIYEKSDLYVDLVHSKRCGDDLQKQIASVQLPIQMSEYEGLPHIPLIGAALLWFVNNDKLALQVLETASKGLEFDDFNFQFIDAALMYYQGDEVGRFFAYLEKVRTTARRQQDIIKWRLDECSPMCSDAVREWGPQLAARARRADLRVVNLAAFAIAEEAGQGLKPAEALLPIAEEYSKKLTEAGEAENTLALDRPTFLDTAAFVVIVAEAKKPVQDSHNLAHAVELLERARALEEVRLSNLALRPKGELINIKLIRSHLATARELLE
jgi:hypothetical protein